MCRDGGKNGFFLLFLSQLLCLGVLLDRSIRPLCPLPNARSLGVPTHFFEQGCAHAYFSKSCRRGPSKRDDKKSPILERRSSGNSISASSFFPSFLLGPIDSATRCQMGGGGKEGKEPLKKFATCFFIPPPPPLDHEQIFFC